MNRQIVAFLSLFSLVLVLSIYYVMLPFTTPKTPNDQNVNVDIEDSCELYFASLQDQKDEVYVSFIDEKTIIIASATATNQEKAEALLAIENKRAQQQKEDDTTNLLLNAGFDAAYVELVNDGTIQIVLAKDKEERTKADIAKAMLIAIQQFGVDSYPTISFYEPPTR
jgi:hypothetical protein